MIEIIDKHKAKLIVNIGSGKKRKRRTKVVEYEKKKDLQPMYVDFERECLRKQDTRDTVEQIVDAYIESRKRLGIKATTVNGYEKCKNRLSADIREEIRF